MERKKVGWTSWRGVPRLVLLMALVTLCLAVSGVALAGEFGVDIPTRNATYSYAIEVPPGRGLTPGIGLDYYGPAGKDYLSNGWNLSGFTFIEWDQLEYENYHQIFEGNYYSEMWELAREGGGDWTGRYHRVSEDYSYYYYDETASKWTVIDKGGTKYEFGSADNSRVTYNRTHPDYPELGSYPVKRWYVDKITDTNGNTVSITYDTSQRTSTKVIYPSSVKWNNDQLRVVNFGWEARSDYNSGNPYYYTWRLQNIDVLANGSRVRQYKITYNGSNNLSGITQYDTGGIAGNISLPATQFSYEASGLLAGIVEPAGGLVSIAYTSGSGTDAVDPRVTKYITSISKNNGLLTSDPLYMASSTGYRWRNYRLVPGGEIYTDRASVVVSDTSSGNDTWYEFLIDTVHPSRMGKMTRTVQYQGARNDYEDDTPLSESMWIWSTRDETYADFAYLYQTSETTYEPTNVVDEMTKHKDMLYSYDAYGNLQQVTVYQDNSSPWVVEKYIKTDYVYNVPAGDPKSTYIVATPKQTYVTNASSVDLSRTRYYYDGATSIETPPTKGNLTKTETWIDGDQGTAANWSAISVSYYTNGNMNTTTDPNGNVSTINSYDATYGTYPTQVTNALGYVNYATYDGGTGQPLTETGANGQVTTYTYDAFKRLEKVIGPLDSSTSPTMKYQYTWTSTPWKTVQSQRIDKYGPTAVYMDSYTFMDGFGNVIQTRTAAEDTSKQIEVDVRTRYDSGAGRWVTEEFLPVYYTPADLGAYNASADTSTGRARVTTQMDALSRAAKVIRPDGSYSTSYYDYDWTTTQQTYDSGGVLKGTSKSYYNGEGKLLRLDQTNNYDVNGDGDGTGSFTYTTQSQYDLLGNTLQVTDAKGYVSTYTYDKLGRVKTSTSPNTGTTTYVYDNAGNVTSVTDAKAQTITFTYDALNRLTQKSY